MWLKVVSYSTHPTRYALGEDKYEIATPPLHLQQGQVCKERKARNDKKDEIALTGCNKRDRAPFDRSRLRIGAFRVVCG